MEFEMNLEQTLNEITGKLYGKNIGACTDAQLYTGVLQLTKEKMAEASVIAGLAFTIPKTTSAHACSYPLTNLPTI